MTDSTSTHRTATARTEEENAPKHPPNWYIALILSGMVSGAIAYYLVYRLTKAAKNQNQ